MPNFDYDKVRDSLLKKGFVEDKSRDHNYYYLVNEAGQKTVVKTKMSHNDQEINDYLFSKMKKQVHLSTKDFVNLINCPLSKENYYKKLKEQKII